MTKETAAFLVALVGILMVPPVSVGMELVLAVETIIDPLPFYDPISGRRTQGAVRDPRPGDEFPPLRVLLSRERYWQQDGHMDVVVQLAPPDAVVLEDSHLEVTLRDADGAAFSQFTIDPVPHERFIFYPRLPADYLGEAEIEVVWNDGQGTIAEYRESFRVKQFDEVAPREGRVRLNIPNPENVTQPGVPMSVGVPFPRGTLTSTGHLRLVDEAGHELPVQIDERARWSKFGSIKWVMCDFTIALHGEPCELYLEYGPDVRRTQEDTFVIAQADGFPVIDTGLLRFDGGLWFDVEGDGNYVKVLGEQALTGAFIEHEDGRLYQMPADEPYHIEEQGDQKIVLRREGWYHEADSGRKFCQYVIRYVIHRDSPFVRIFHSWIFTGDGNRDRVASMGWQFELAGGLEPMGFLESFDADSDWLMGDSLVQWDYEHFDLLNDGQRHENAQARAAGVAVAGGGGVRLYFGVKDFWQNYPSELEFRDGSFWFHNWPRRNRKAQHTFDKELLTQSTRPAVSASAERYEHEASDQLTRSEWKLNAIQTRWAHEGEMLNFRLPDPLAEDPVWETSNDSRFGNRNAGVDKGEPETLNAQGISRTEEMWLYLAHSNDEPTEADRILRAMNDETLRPIVDPAWAARSGAFYEIHHQDWAKYPEEERIYERVALSPYRIAERLGVYGMWIYGDLPAWGLRLDRMEPELYRAYRRHHLGWPYPWTPFVRSGDPRLFKWADASTRQLIDVAWLHYYDERVDRLVGPNRHRRKGVLNTYYVPWGSGSNSVPMTRSQQTRVDYLLDAWHLTGYHRAKDRALAWAEQAKIEEAFDGSRRGVMTTFGRNTTVPMKAFLETYEVTFDPWFLVAAHAVSEGHLHGYSNESIPYRDSRYGGRQWDTGDREFLRFTGSDEYRDFFLNRHAARAISERVRTVYNRRRPMYAIKSYAWKLTGDAYYLRRLAHAMENTLANVRDADEPDYLQGFWHGNPAGRGYTMFTPIHLRWFPHALWAIEQAGQLPPPIYSTFNAELPEQDDAGYPHRLTLAFPKESQTPLHIDLKADGMNYVPTTRRVSDDEHVRFALLGPDTPPIEQGEWQLNTRQTLTIEADASPGIYRLELHYPPNATNRFDLPAGHLGAGEVLVLTGDDVTPDIGWRSYWFMVPEGAAQFTIERFGPSAILFNADDQEVWRADGAHPSDMDLVQIEVAPNQAGRLWRIAHPGELKLGPAIAPYFAVEPDRWFDLGPYH